MSVSVVRVIRTPIPRRLAPHAGQQPDLEGNVLPASAGKEDTRISRVHTSMSRVDRDDMSRAEAIRKPTTVGGRRSGGEPGRHPSRELVEANGAGIVANRSPR